MSTNRIQCQSVLTDNEITAIDGFAANNRGTSALSTMAQFLRDTFAADLVVDQEVRRRAGNVSR